MRIDLKHLEYAAREADEAVAKGPQPTAVVAVANSDEMLWSHVSPGADGVKLDSIFLIASITKPVLATAVMRLVEEGKLGLNVSVAAYLPEFGANDKGAVTTWHLLTHSSGVEEDRFMGELQAIGQAGGEPPRGFLYDAACRSYLNFEPGTAYRYNSMTYSVLAELVTRLGGEAYPEYLRYHVFEPLGMVDTAFAPGERSRTAPIYGLGPPQLVEGFIRMEMPGGGLWSTAADLVAFGQTYLRGGTSVGGYKLLSPASIDLMTRNYSQGVRQFGTGDRFNYGLGWGKRSWQPDGDLLASEKAFGHGGASGTMLWVDPEYDFVFVFMSNGWDMVDPFGVRARCLNVVYGAVSI